MDSVNEVLRMPYSIVEPPPCATVDSGTNYISGVARLDDRLLIPIDLSRLIDDSVNILSDNTEKAAYIKTKG